MCDGLCPGWGHSTAMSLTWEVKHKFLSNGCTVIVIARPSLMKYAQLASRGSGSLQMAHGCQGHHPAWHREGPHSSNQRPTALPRALG